MKFDMADPQSRIPPHSARIFLDGVQARQVVAADEEAGYIEVWETDAQGKIIAFRDEYGKPYPRRKRIHGIVKICES